MNIACQHPIEPIPAPEIADTAIVAGRRRGRGAGINPSGRFEAYARTGFDDGWGDGEELPPFKTTVQIEPARSVITRNDSPDIAFDRSLNPYRGCEHGCIYCYARPNHAYLGLSPGLDFETRLYAKTNAAEVLERQLGAPSYQPKVIAIGTATDAYQPIEKEQKVTRRVLEMLAKTQHPALIITKSALVLRDIDILQPMAAQGLVKVAISITTLDRRLARAMEPRASSPQRRLDAIQKLTEAGIPVGVMVAPVIPAVTDSEIERILEAAHTFGAREAGYVLLRLPLEVSEIFREFLLRELPDRYRHVMNVLKSMRGGKDYDAEWGKRMRGTGPYAWQIGRRFELTAKRLGLNKHRIKLDTEKFLKPGNGGVQLSLF
ncbi:hypothetical protein ANOBCDAF_01680 [Pleomorphomonas sp. T1.2MG-36]|uniref:PA0069 family radical SAM protein n=1 Tax=Pleomorphomonas sp. T1.2MG-36 TaxID=3041167 RepID=UPI002477BF6A|nr:PA0069 family radical SAM protein [Pleomorphomonas sp. T1.2MG-36]CAI9407557.1 hypothetical protein ANOBCDAF_01680 [Pleomorphomonas sp. T1.2MG-36]